MAVHVADFDTGAVISVFARSTAELLGFGATQGEPIDLISVGGSKHRYFVHKVWARLVDSNERLIRMAFADTEDVPDLFGRVDVLEGIIMTLHGGNGTTTISTA